MVLALSFVPDSSVLLTLVIISSWQPHSSHSPPIQMPFPSLMGLQCQLQSKHPPPSVSPPHATTVVLQSARPHDPSGRVGAWTLAPHPATEAYRLLDLCRQALCTRITIHQILQTAIGKLEWMWKVLEEMKVKTIRVCVRLLLALGYIWSAVAPSCARKWPQRKNYNMFGHLVVGCGATTKRHSHCFWVEEMILGILTETMDSAVGLQLQKNL